VDSHVDDMTSADVDDDHTLDQALALGPMSR